MKTLLQLNTSLFADNGNSTRLANRFVAAWRAQNPGGRVIVRDLVDDPVQHLTAEHVMAFGTPADQRTPEQAARVALDDVLIAEIQAADVVVLGVPMINFGIPVQLKNWIDAISRAKVTFQYTANGPEGLLKGKKVVIALTRGGQYRNTPADTQVPYLKTVLSFLGMSDIQLVYAEGLAMGPEAEQQALASAQSQIEALAIEEPVAA